MVGVFYKTPSLEGGLLGPLSVRVTTKGGIRYSPFSILRKPLSFVYVGNFIYICGIIIRCLQKTTKI